MCTVDVVQIEALGICVIDILDDVVLSNDLKRVAEIT